MLALGIATIGVASATSTNEDRWWFPGSGSAQQEEGDELVQAASQTQYERLAALKTKYDPNNIFRLNQNTKPDSA